MFHAASTEPISTKPENVLDNVHRCSRCSTLPRPESDLCDEQPCRRQSLAHGWPTQRQLFRRKWRHYEVRTPFSVVY